MNYDFFISHAGADKDSFVRPLANALIAEGYSVWFDELSILPGESIRSSIDLGISQSDAGIVVLSTAFFDRNWTHAELDALMALTIKGKKHIVPIWLGLNEDDVAKVSPLMADRKAINGSLPVEVIVREISRVLPIRPISNEHLSSVVSGLKCADEKLQQFFFHRSMSRLCALAALSESYNEAIHQIYPEDHEYSDNPADFDKKMDEWWAHSLRIFEIPSGVYIEDPYPISKEDLQWASEVLASWVLGVLTPDEIAEIYFWLDESIDADYLFVFFGIPNHRVSVKQREILDLAIVEIGSRKIGLPRDFSFEKWISNGLSNWLASIRRN